MLCDYVYTPGCHQNCITFVYLTSLSVFCAMCTKRFYSQRSFFRKDGKCTFVLQDKSIQQFRLQFKHAFCLARGVRRTHISVFNNTCLNQVPNSRTDRDHQYAYTKSFFLKKHVVRYIVIIYNTLAPEQFSVLFAD